MLTEALQRARRAAQLSGGAILVGFSGGKESLAVADILVRSQAFRRIELFSMALVQGLDCFETPIRAFAAARQLRVHFVPHWDLSRLLKHAILRPHLPGAEKLRLMKLRDVELALTSETGIGWFAYGERAADSYARRLYTRKNDGINEAWRRAWPVWNWSTAHVYAYLKARKIPAPERFGSTRKAGGSGISLDPACLLQLKKGHPRDYAKILEVFPGAEAQCWRAERQQQRGAGATVSVPDVQNRATAPLRRQKRAV